MDSDQIHAPKTGGGGRGWVYMHFLVAFFFSLLVFFGGFFYLVGFFEFLCFDLFFAWFFLFRPCILTALISVY